MPVRRAAAVAVTAALAFGISLIPAEGSPLPLSAPPTVALASPSALLPVATHYSNCAKLNKKYPHGVGKKGARDHTSGTPVTNFTRSNTVYAANKARDRDKDGIACERH